MPTIPHYMIYTDSIGMDLLKLKKKKKNVVLQIDGWKWKDVETSIVLRAKSKVICMQYKAVEVLTPVLPNVAPEL